jgi:TMEM175 potassium channel family protein
MSTGRAEAFSDGVFAIAITLLVLDIHVPSPGPGQSLGHELAVRWPSYAAYVVSFLSIGIIWINHHAMFRRLRVVDHSILVWNLLLLMSVGVLPFTTALMAAYLTEGQGEILAAAVYSGSFLVMSVIFAATNRHILFGNPQLLEEGIDPALKRQAISRGVVGLLPYLLATVLAFVSPYLTLGICAAIAVFYALPFASATAGVASGPAPPSD